MLGLFFMLTATPAIALPQKHNKHKGVVHSMTVLAVRPANNDEPYFNVLFRISQRIYKLPKDANPAYLALLKESATKHTPVLVRRANEGSDVIMGVERAN